MSSTVTTTPAADQDEFDEVAERIRAAMRSVVDGKPEACETALTVLLAQGHLLVEDVPGVGKTLLAKTLASVLACTVRRIQFTPDLLPSDITGVTVFNRDSSEFEFRPGAVFANIVVGDEINRASPKTQSALLEAMAERQVTVDARTYGLSEPFMVLATQNPIEMEGTYPLPEAQRDRFMARISMGYPDEDAELQVLQTHGRSDPLGALTPVADAETVSRMIERAASVYVAEAIQRYIVRLVAATRDTPELRLGASPRAGLQLLRAARAGAALDGRDYVLPDDVQRWAVPVLSHRVIPAADARLGGRGAEDLVRHIIGRVPVPAANSN